MRKDILKAIDDVLSIREGTLEDWIWSLEHERAYTGEEVHYIRECINALTAYKNYLSNRNEENTDGRN